MKIEQIGARVRPTHEDRAWAAAAAPTEFAAARLQDRLSERVPRAVVRADLRRQARRHFGRHMVQLRPGAVMLDLGARSGLAALQVALRDPTATVVAVETRAALYTALQETLRINDLSNVHLFRAVTPALEFARSRTLLLDDVKVERSLFSHELLGQLVRFEIGHLGGGFDHSQADPIEVYRLSKRHAATFWWNRPNGLPPISGRGREGPDVSVIVPAYGVAQYLPQCLESLVDQSIASKEIIVVDDGSTDGSGAVAESWASRHPCIRVIHKPNGGCASARSAGLHAAQGEFIGFVDGDDWVHEHMFEDLYRAAVADSADIAQCGYMTVGIDGAPRAPEGDAVRPRGLVRKPRDLLVGQPTIWRRLYRSRFLAAHKLDFDHDIKRFDDLPFQFESLAAATRVTAIPNRYYHYRLDRPEQDVAIRDKRLYVHFDIFRRLRAVIATRGTSSVEAQLRRVELNTHLWALGRLDPSLRRAYAREAASDIMRHRLILGSLDKLWIAAGRSPAFALRMLVALATEGWRKPPGAA